MHVINILFLHFINWSTLFYF